MSAIDVQLPASTIAASTTMGALTGLSGYMTLGLGSKPKPAACQINDTESLVVKDSKDRKLIRYLVLTPSCR